MFSGRISEWILFLLSKFLLKKRGLWKTGRTPERNQDKLNRENQLEEQLSKYLRDLMWRFADFNNRVILDLGCGDGKKTKYFAEKTKKAIGIDKNRLLLDEARKRAPANCEFKIGEDETVPVEDNNIEIVTCIETWEHIYSPQKILDELYRILRKEGIVFIYFAPWLYPSGAHVEYFIPLPWCHVFFTDKTICNVINKIEACNDFIPPPYAINADGSRKMFNGVCGSNGKWLNKVSERKFRMFLKDNNHKFSLVHYELLGFGGHSSRISRFSRGFRYLPIFRELIGGFIFCVLRKK